MDEIDIGELMELPLVSVEDTTGDVSPENYQYWLDRENRVFYVDYYIDDKGKLLELCKAITAINMEDKDSPVEELVPIKIFVMSYGGDMDQTCYLCDLIKASRTPVWTIATGVSMSAGMYILISGKRRFVFPHTRVLVHSGSASLNGSAIEVSNAADAYKKQLNSMKSYILENTEISKKLLDRKWKSDWHMTAQECVEYGLVDEIITDLSTIL